MNAPNRPRLELSDLRWCTVALSLECLRTPPHSRPGHALEVVNALLKAVTREPKWRVAFHADGVPLTRRKLRAATIINLHFALIGFSSQEAEGWLTSLMTYINKRSNSNFRAFSASGPHERRLNQLRLPRPSTEWRLDFLTPLPFPRAKHDTRTCLRASTFVQTLHGRFEHLFNAKLSLPAAQDAVELLPYYWHYEELRSVSASQNKTATTSATPPNKHPGPHLRYFNGCAGPLFVRGDLASLAPWLAMAEELHAGGTLELNPLGHFRLLETSAPFLDRELDDSDALIQVAEAAFRRNDLALAHVRDFGGPLEPASLARSLACELASGSYSPGPTEAFDIPKPAGGSRTIERLAPRDLIVQQRLHQLLVQPFDSSFSPASVAYRRGLSRESAVARVRELIAAGHRYVVRADISNFFPSIEHARLLAALDRLLPRSDTRMRTALSRVIATPLSHNGEVRERTIGLAQGSPLSPLFANVYLDAFDRVTEESGIEIVRYGDDFVLLARSRETATAALQNARSYLAPLGLTLSTSKTVLGEVAAGFDFLGERFDDRDTEQRARSIVPERHPLVITEPYLMLAVNGDALDLRREGMLVRTVPFRYVSEIIVLGKAVFSTALLERCAHYRIPVAVALEHGHQIGTFPVHSRAYHEVALHQARRYEAMNAPERVAIAADIAASKILNYTHLIRARYQAGDSALLQALVSHVDSIRTATSNETIRGHEGHAARAVFAWLNHAIATPAREHFVSPRRDRNAPDRLNSMLNFGYYLLFTRINGLVRSCGLNPYLGFLHESQEDYETLVADIQELFRAHVDRLVLRLINRGEISGRTFEQQAHCTRLSKEAIQRYVEGFETLFAEIHDGVTLNDALALQIANLKHCMVDGHALRLYRWGAGAISSSPASSPPLDTLTHPLT